MHARWCAARPTRTSPSVTFSIGLLGHGTVGSAFHTLLQKLVESGAPWPEVEDSDLRDWPHDPVGQTPAFMNVLAWGRKTTE